MFHLTVGILIIMLAAAGLLLVVRGAILHVYRQPRAFTAVVTGVWLFCGAVLAMDQTLVWWL